MKYTIVINQKAIVDNSMDLDILDAAIVQYIVDYAHSGRMKTKHFEGKIYYWVNYEQVIEEMPLLGLKNRDSVYRRVRKIEKAGVLEQHPDNMKMCSSYFCFGEKYHLLVYKPSDNHPRVPGRKKKTLVPSENDPKPSDEKQGDPRMIIRTPSDIYPGALGYISDPPSDENPSYYTILNPTINPTKKEEEEVAEATPHATPLVENFLKKEKGPTSKDFEREYDQLVQKRIGAPPKLNGKEGKALREIMDYLKESCPEKNLEGALRKWEYILSHWDTLEEFYQKKLRLSEINQNMVNILDQIRHPKGKLTPVLTQARAPAAPKDPTITSATDQQRHDYRVLLEHPRITEQEREKGIRYSKKPEVTMQQMDDQIEKTKLALNQRVQLQTNTS